MKIFYIISLIFLFNLVQTTEFSADYIGDVDHFNIVYNLYSETVNNQIEKLLQDDPDRVVKMKNVDQEEYQCIMPVIEKNSQKMIDEYRGPSPSEIIQTLNDEKIISFYSDNGYWYYDIAHGRYILQYHENRETKERTEYSLGSYREDQVKQDLKNFDQLKPPKTKIREVNYAHYPVHYRHGTPCDLTNKPRETTVMYVCYEAAKHMIYSINEISTCNYEIVVLTNLLCGHPAFQPYIPPEHEIKCYSSKKQTIAKPKNLRELEKEIFAEGFEQYSMNADSSTVPHKSAIFNKLVSPEVDTFTKNKGKIQLEEPSEPGLNTLLKDDLKKLMDIYMQSKNPDSLLPALKKIDDEMKEEDFQMMDDFWSGKSCFIGGQGYWKYEFCYNGKITQFHVENYKRTKEIVLGKYDEKKHKEWFLQNKNRAIRKENDMIKEVWYNYDDGDYCEEIKSKRDVLVKIKCRMPADDLPLNIVLISVDEGTQCKYILTLESPLLCEGLQLIDENAILDSEKLTEKYQGMNLKDFRDSLEKVTKEKDKKKS